MKRGAVMGTAPRLGDRLKMSRLASECNQMEYEMGDDKKMGLSLFEVTEAPKTVDEWLKHRASLVRASARYDLYIVPILDLDDAKFLLDHMDPRQRDARRHGHMYVANYLHEMMHGNWSEELTQIYVSREQMTVADCQHRLIAFVKVCEQDADFVWRDVLVKVVSDIAIARLDRGRTRGHEDATKFLLGKRVHQSVSRALVFLRRGISTQDIRQIPDSERNEAIEAYESLPDIISMQKRSMFRSFGFLTAYAYCLRENRSADVFFKTIARGNSIIDDKASTSAQALLRTMHDLKRRSKGNHSVKFHREIVVKCVKAFNGWASGKEVSALRYSDEEVQDGKIVRHAEPVPPVFVGSK